MKLLVQYLLFVHLRNHSFKVFPYNRRTKYENYPILQNHGSFMLKINLFQHFNHSNKKSPSIIADYSLISFIYYPIINFNTNKKKFRYVNNYIVISYNSFMKT
jgi:hypothetical protein